MCISTEIVCVCVPKTYEFAITPFDLTDIEDYWCAFTECAMSHYYALHSFSGLEMLISEIKRYSKIQLNKKIMASAISVVMTCCLRIYNVCVLNQLNTASLAANFCSNFRVMCRQFAKHPYSPYS